MEDHPVLANLKAKDEAFSTMGHFDLVDRFVMRNGKPYEAAPYFGKRGTPKECFTNAVHYAMRNSLDYVEGFMYRKDLPILIHHAWVAGKDGVVIDPTLDRPEECHFFGVPFNAKRAWNRMLKTGYYGLYMPNEMVDIEFLARKDKLVKEDLRMAREAMKKNNWFKNLNKDL